MKTIFQSNVSPMLLMWALFLMIHSGWANEGDISFSDRHCEALKIKFHKMCSEDVPPVTRIVGGRRARPEESKFMVRIGYGPKGVIDYNCGGSLIHERWALSAAHCAIEKKFSPGLPTFIKLAWDKRIIAVDMVVSHPGFTEKKSYNDVLLIRLKTPVKFDCKVQPVCLYTAPVLKTKTASIFGWGRTGLDSDPSKHLLTANVVFFNNSYCNELYSSVVNASNGMIGKGIQNDIQLCAGTVSGKKDTCLGDSGGPLIISKKGSSVRTQVGITSFGYGCGAALHPGVYVRISHFIPWIESIIRKY